MTDVLIAFSDTGGGHRAAASAIRDALANTRHDIDITLVDPWAICPRWPFRQLSRAYPAVIERAPWLWSGGFALTNTPQRAAFAERLAWPVMRPTFEKIASAQRPDVIVSTHPLLTAPLRRAFPGTPLVVVVTDLISGHVSWYNRCADLTIVPTAAARDRAIACGVESDRVAVMGVPVSRPFIAVPGEKSLLQQQLGWPTNKPIILLAGGAEGIGPLEALSVAIDRAQLPCDIAVVAGRNSALAERLRARRWQGTVHVYDFVTNFAELMRAASVLVTKAGPGTISEACASGCPVILSGAIPGQETGNVDFVTRGRAGVWAPSPLAVTAALHAWLVGRDAPAALRRASHAALRLARPDAAHEIATSVLQLADGVASAVPPARLERTAAA
jgi:1,2-diacylglycerol 3-beta-galactosyltransferase